MFLASQRAGHIPLTETLVNFLEPVAPTGRLLAVRGAVLDTERVRMQPTSAAARATVARHAAPPEVASGFDVFYDAHHAPVAKALALTLGDTELGFEATDEAMTRAYQRWGTVRTYDNPAGWVYRVGLNWARSFLRRKKRVTSSPDLEELPTHDPAPSDPALAQALARLDPKHRSVVVLRYLLDWSVDQTADALGVAPGTVKSRLHRALEQLERTMRERDTP